MRWKNGLVAAGVLLVSSMGPAMAQMGQPRMDPLPEEPMARMMTMMQEMRAETQSMREQMEQHRQQMMQQCSGFKGPMSPKSGG
jgi:hypothetical protein